MDKKVIIWEVEKSKEIANSDKVVAVYLFGSVVAGQVGEFSDVDVCVIGKGFSWDEKIKIMGDFGEDYDVSFFEDMPVWIQMRVLKGSPIIVNDKDRLYDISFAALRKYEDFKIMLNERVKRRFGKCMI